MAVLKAAKKELRRLLRKELAEVSGDSIAEQSIAVAARLFAMPSYKAARRIGIYLSMPKGEIMTRTIVNDALAQDKQVFVPYVYDAPPDSGEGRPRKLMEMVSLFSRDDYEIIEHSRDTWGIPFVKPETVPERHKILDDEDNTVWTVRPNPTNPEAAEKRKECSSGNLDMIVMPGMGFDRKCGRLGHGKGFYDFFLHRYHEDKIHGADPNMNAAHGKGMPFLVGLALSEQVKPEGQEVPTDASDWNLDAVIVGDGSIIERPASNT